MVDTYLTIDPYLAADFPLRPFLYYQALGTASRSICDMWRIGILLPDTTSGVGYDTDGFGASRA